MKVPPKRKGNRKRPGRGSCQPTGLNESPSEKEGKCGGWLVLLLVWVGLNESPSEKEGKLGGGDASGRGIGMPQ